MLKVPVLTPSLPIRRERESGRAVRLPAESMLALLISSVGFTPGMRPAPSARSSKFHRESGAIRVDLEGASPEIVEVAEALESVVSELQDIYEIQELVLQNMQKSVSLNK